LVLPPARSHNVDGGDAGDGHRKLSGIRWSCSNLTQAARLDTSKTFSLFRKGQIIMAISQTDQTMQGYLEALRHHDDFAKYFSDDVEAILEGTEQHYRGREPVRQWIEAAHSLGEVKLLRYFTAEGYAAGEFEFIRQDGVAVPYTVIYDLKDEMITSLRLYFTGPIQT
jgi:hypothetical protein